MISAIIYGRVCYTYTSLIWKR